MDKAELDTIKLYNRCIRLLDDETRDAWCRSRVDLNRYLVKKVSSKEFREAEKEDRGRGGFLDSTTLNYGTDTYMKSDKGKFGYGVSWDRRGVNEG
jgi:hypothetical protein